VQGLDRTLDNPAILILDEADQLDCSEVLYHFHSISNLSLIFIANREVDLFAGLEERVDSRVRAGRRVRFTRYSDEEVTDILHKRATHALHGDAISSDILAEIAARADGDARLAINILRETVQAAATAGLHNVTLAHVREATPRAEEHVHQKNLSKLNSHQRVICEVLDEHGPCNQGEMYDHYESTHPDPITLRALREHHLPKLEHYNLLSVSRVGRGKRYDIQSPHE
jgi:Cdc6-like AAA superfamily ATPase